MEFDFDKFSEITASVYPRSGPYSIEEALGVFRYYFQRYENYMGHPHPPIRAIQIKRLCECMPFLDQAGGNLSDIDPDSYPVMIDRYFETWYRNCDRNINHFFSGRIRGLKLYEALR